MDKVKLLLERLDAIGASLAKREGALALLGLGSCGLETARMDQYSDLDFFAIVEDGQQANYLADLSWLSDIAPVAYAFRNTRDGFKLLYEDGIFCEFAVFDHSQLAGIPYPEGRIVWQAQRFDPAIFQPATKQPEPKTAEFLLGEALTNLYVGLGRFHRGEKRAAFRFIQGYAVDRVIDLAPHLETEQPADVDLYDSDRRFEQRFPTVAAQLPSMVLGDDESPASAKAILTFLDAHFEVNMAMKLAILELC